MSGGLVLLMVGDELLDGRTRDTNSAWLIDRARAEGWRVDAVEVLGDDVQRLAAALLRHGETARAIVVTGGLGPTEDDLSREALAAALGVGLVLDEAVLSALRRRFEQRGRRMAPSNRRQAFRPTTSEVIENPVGTAVGLRDRVREATVLLLPGVPAELEAMFDDHVRPLLDPLLAGGALPARRLRTTQVAESVLATMVEEVLEDRADFALAYCVSTWGVDLLLRNPDPERLEQRVALLRGALGDRVYAEGDLSLPAAVVQECARTGRTLAVAESCTGGLVGAALTSVPGSSEAFLGGVVAYADAAKSSQLGVDPDLLRTYGAVSEEVARAMARGARERFGARLAVSTTGIAGPGGGTADKPVGTVCVGLATTEGEVSGTLRLGGDRELVRRWSVAAALDALRRGRIGRA